jgi:hypothetical protein
MVQRTQVQLIITLSVIVWAVLLLLQGTPLHTSYLRPYSLVVGTVIICLTAYDRFLWRVKPFRFIPGQPPLLQGTWKGSLVSSYLRDGKPIPPIQAFMVIRQSYSSVTVSLMTEESKSQSIVATINGPSPGYKILSSTYINTPELLIRGRSAIHHGSFVVDILGDPPGSLEGSYWTDRDTKGQLRFDKHTAHLHSDYSTARADPLLQD